MKKTMITLAIVAVSSSALGFCGGAAFAAVSSREAVAQATVHTHAEAEGSHCSGTVGCGCSGFSPITGGKVWEQSYCKKCGHKKSLHR